MQLLPKLAACSSKCDVTSEEDGAAVVLAANEMGPMRALVNSAGIGMAGRTIDRDNNPMDLNIFKKVIEINLIGSFNMLRSVRLGHGQDRT